MVFVLKPLHVTLSENNSFLKQVKANIVINRQNILSDKFENSLKAQFTTIHHKTHPANRFINFVTL